MRVEETWVLVADAGRARVLRLASARGPLEPALETDLVGETRPGREVMADRPGRTFDSEGAGRHAKEPSTDPDRVARERFAREIATRLDAERRQGRFERLVIVAPPGMLGELRAALPEATAAVVKAEVGKDFTTLEPAALLERLSEALRG